MVHQRVCARNHALRIPLQSLRMTVPLKNQEGYRHSLAMNTGHPSLTTVDEVPQEVLGERIGGEGPGETSSIQEGAAMAAPVDTCHRHLHADM